MDKLPVNSIICGNCIEVMRGWPADSINCIITSPPYWSLRNYGSKPVVWGGDKSCKHKWQRTAPRRRRTSDDSPNSPKQTANRAGADKLLPTNICSLCGAWRGEHGLEPTPELYIKHSMMVFDEVKRVLRPDGVLFVNIADTYAGGGTGKGQDNSNLANGKPAKGFRSSRYLNQRNPSRLAAAPAKSLCAIPERFVLAMAEHGWIRRCTIIWAKGVSFCDSYSGSCMPDSAKDRPNKNGFEYVYMFTKNKKYYYEQQYEKWIDPRKRSPAPKHSNNPDVNLVADTFSQYGENPLGRTIRNVWIVNPQAYPDSHYATFPEELVRPLIRMGTPEFVCKKCGLPRVKIYGVKYQKAGGKGQEKYDTNNQSGGLESGACTPQSMKYGRANKITKEAGLSDCGCNAGFRPGIVLDPFFGSGTVGKVAAQEGRDWLGIDIQPKYIEQAKMRTTEGETGVSVAEQKHGQKALFSE